MYSEELLKKHMLKCVDDMDYIRNKDVNTFLADFRYATGYKTVLNSLAKESSDFAE